MNSYGKGAFVATLKPMESIMDQLGDQAQRPIYTCCRCSTIVPPENDLFEVMCEWFDTKYGLKGAEPFDTHRHFLPVFDGVKKICEGSKSNAQYIEGQPRDDRGDPEDAETDAQHEENAKPFREAYRRVQEKFATRT